MNNEARCDSCQTSQLQDGRTTFHSAGVHEEFLHLGRINGDSQEPADVWRFLQPEPYYPGSSTSADGIDVLGRVQLVFDDQLDRGGGREGGGVIPLIHSFENWFNLGI